MKKVHGILALALFGTSPAFAAVGYVCQSAESDPASFFTVSLQTNGARGMNPNEGLLADITIAFSQPNVPATAYKAVPYSAPDSGDDHVAFEGEGISVVVYPNPKLLSTIVIGDAGAEQTGFVMSCRSSAN